MKLEFISGISKSLETSCLVVHIHTNKKTFIEFLKQHKLKKSNANSKIIENGKRLWVHLFNTKYKLFSAKELASGLSHIKDDLIIDLSHIHSSTDKLLVSQILCKQFYTFDKYKTNGSKQRSIYLYDTSNQQDHIKDIILQITVTNMNRDFQNEPANMINPSTFCDYVQRMFQGQSYVKIKIFDEKHLIAMGLNMIQQMGKASVHKSRFLVIEYMSPSKSKETFALVGKGVCFDAGGLNIKTNQYMSPSMKSDKTGGTTAASMVLYAAKAKLKCNIIALIPLIENVISGEALHPGDIIKTYDKKTVEIKNTDAEGRVIMTDALAYTKRYPKITYLFDLATLTGQSDSFIPDTTSVHFTLNKKLSGIIENLGEQIGERSLRLPAYEEYTNATKSNVADFKNYDFEPYNKNSTYMAAVYLLNFVPKHLKPWYVHFDISNSFPKGFSNGNVTILIMNLIKYILKNK